MLRGLRSCPGGFAAPARFVFVFLNTFIADFFRS